MWGQLAQGFADALTLANVLFVAAGIVIGNVVGVLPGLSRTTAVAVAIPLTFTMSPLSAIAFLVGINKGSASGSAISAILINTPGEASAAATALDGYPLTRQGKARKALETALYASVSGDFLGTVVLVLLAAPLAQLALRIGPVEILSIVLFSLTFIAGLAGRSLIKGLIAGALGMVFASVGLDIETGTPRLTFGMPELFDGIPLISLGIGMLALSEMLVQMEPGARRLGAVATRFAHERGQHLSWPEFRGCIRTVFRSSAIGIAVGALPGLGASVGSFLSYAAAQRADPRPERFGQGAVEGVAAAEAADNAVIPASMIPLFALGIPGNLATALLIGAFLIHGINPGPQVFVQNGDLVYSIFASMLIASVLLLVIGYVGLHLFAEVTRLPSTVIAGCVVLFCVTGAYLDGSSMFSVYLMLFFGALGYFLKKLDFSFITFVIGFILTPILDLSLRQTLVLTDRKVSALLDHPIAVGFLVLTLVAGWRFSRRR